MPFSKEDLYEALAEKGFTADNTTLGKLLKDFSADERAFNALISGGYRHIDYYERSAYSYDAQRDLRWKAIALDNAKRERTDAVIAQTKDASGTQEMRQALASLTERIQALESPMPAIKKEVPGAYQAFEQKGFNADNDTLRKMLKEYTEDKTAFKALLAGGYRNIDYYESSAYSYDAQRDLRWKAAILDAARRNRTDAIIAKFQPPAVPSDLSGMQNYLGGLTQRAEKLDEARIPKLSADAQGFYKALEERGGTADNAKLERLLEEYSGNEKAFAALVTGGYKYIDQRSGQADEETRQDIDARRKLLDEVKNRRNEFALSKIFDVSATQPQAPADMKGMQKSLNSLTEQVRRLENTRRAWPVSTAPASGAKATPSGAW